MQTPILVCQETLYFEPEKQIELNSSEPRLILLGMAHTTTPLLWRKLLDRSTPYSCFLEYFGRFSIERSSWSIQPSPLPQHTGIRAARADHNTKAHCTMLRSVGQNSHYNLPSPSWSSPGCIQRLWNQRNDMNTV